MKGVVEYFAENQQESSCAKSNSSPHCNMCVLWTVQEQVTLGKTKLHNFSFPMVLRT